MSEEKQTPPTEAPTEPQLVKRGAGLDIAVGLTQGLGAGAGTVGAAKLIDHFTGPPKDPPPPTKEIIIPAGVEKPE